MWTNKLSEFAIPVLKLAVCYFLLGIVGLLFAIPPGYSSPVFPAAAAGFIAVLSLGSRVLPGIWLGSVSINLWVAWGNQDVNLIGFLVASFIGVGSSLQARVASKLIKNNRRLDWQSLGKKSDIIRFLLLAGPLACLVSATWGCFTLLIFRAISWADFFSQWWHWWAGDTIGVILFAPLFLMVVQRRERIWKKRLKYIAIPVLTTIVGVVLAFGYVFKNEESIIKQHVDNVGKPIASTLKSKADEFQTIVDSLAGLISVNSELKYSEFKQFTDPIFNKHPELHALSWNPEILDKNREQFETFMQQQGLKDFKITQRDDKNQLIAAKQRHSYIPVAYINPLDNNMSAIGYDIASNATRIAAIAQARITGETVATAPIRLVQETGSSIGLLLLVPVKLDNAGTENSTFTRLLGGFAVGVFRIEKMLQHLFEKNFPEGFVIVIHDKNAQEPNKLLYSSASLKTPVNSEFSWQSEIMIANRIWQVSVFVTDSYIALNYSLLAWQILVAGLLFASLLQVLLLNITGRNETILQQVRMQRNELAEQNRYLQQSEQRSSLSQAYGEVGIWAIDFIERKQLWSATCLKLFGFSGKSTPSWRRFLRLVNLGDRRKLISTFLYHMEQGGKLDIEFRIKLHTIDERWMRIAGQVEFDSGNQPVQMLGIVQDISARKLAQEQQALAALAYENSSEAMMVTDNDNKILTINPAFTKLTGYTKDDILGMTPKLLSSGRQNKAFYQAMWNDLNTKGHWQGELWNRRKNGNEYLEWLTINTVFNTDGSVHRRIALFSDITEKEKKIC